MAGLIAIVGRPNVGKSALFNRIVKKRIAIVHDEPGVTRDRVTAAAEWGGKSFTLVDTGGIGLLRGEKAKNVISQAAMDQVNIAIEAAEVIILVVNVQEGVVPLDREAAQRLRSCGKPVLVAVNKTDTARAEGGVSEFSALGFDKIFAVSAIHGEGIEALMHAATSSIPVSPEPVEAVSESTADGFEGASASLPDCVKTPKHRFGTSKKWSSNPSPQIKTPHIESVEVDFLAVGQTNEFSHSLLRRRLHEETSEGDAPRKADQPLKLAIVGRPNVGKSSLINALTNSERVIVSPTPGTTRDSVDVPFEVTSDGIRESYVLIDTAGMRKNRRIDDSIEFFSVKRAEESIMRSDIVILVLDAISGITEQDKKVADKIVEARRACIVVVNKWDLMDEAVRKAREEEIERRVTKQNKRGPKQMTTLSEFGGWVQEHLFFLDYAPVIFTSALSGFHLDRLLEAVRYVASQLKQKIPTSILNRTLQDAVERRQPVSSHGDRLRFYYATQVRKAPPTFLLFVNRETLFSDAYKKYLAQQVRAAFGYEGCPVVLVPKPRPRTIEPMRRFKKLRPGGAPAGVSARSRGNRRPEAGKRRGK